MNEFLRIFVRMTLVALLAATLSTRAMAMEHAPMPMERSMTAGMQMSCCVGDRHGSPSTSSTCDAGCAATMEAATHVPTPVSRSLRHWDIVGSDLKGLLCGPAPPPPRSA